MRIAAVLFVFSVTLDYPAFATQPLAGFWVMPDGAAVVEIYAVDVEQWAVRIAALRDPFFTEADGDVPHGTARTDINNPEPNKRHRSLIGLEIGEGFRLVDNKLAKGKIYDPGSGNTYKAELRVTPSGLLDVRGYIGLSFIGKTMYWHPFDDYAQRTSAMLDAIAEHEHSGE